MMGRELMVTHREVQVRRDIFGGKKGGQMSKKGETRRSVRVHFHRAFLTK